MVGTQGTIVRIKCKHFLTYDSMEVFPGDKLNVIIGPNGTGKSTLACAIVLGLAGKTSVIGRSKQLNAFVQHGQNKSCIEIELMNTNPNQENYVIKRVFNLNNDSQWTINGSHKTETQVKALVKNLNIQIDNLCQFLPQDRVQDFAKMNNQQLFINTLKSIGGTEMEQTLDNLKNLQVTRGRAVKEIDSKTKTLEQEEVTNRRLEGEVINSKNRQKLLDNIDLINQKKMWLQYNEKCAEREELQKESDAIKKRYNSEKEKAKPLEDQIKRKNQEINNIKNQTVPLNNNLQNHFSGYNNCKEECYRVKTANDLLEDKIKNLDDEEASLRKEIETKKTFLLAAQNNAGNQIDETKLNATIERCQVILKKQLKEAQQAKDTRARLEESHENVERQLLFTERKLKQLDNVQYQKEQNLGEMSPDALKATKWLRENGNLFKGKVFEPMLLMINIKRPEFVRQVEKIISRDDLVAFSCEKAEDASVLLQEMRIKRKWGVNIVTIPDVNKRKSIRNQPYPIEQLSRFGFSCYASDVIEVPAGIRTYLDLTYDLQCIPIGGKEVSNHHYNNSIPDGIRKYFSNEFQYVVRRSELSGNIISQTFALDNAARYFKVSLDTELRKQLQVDLKQLREQKQDFDNQVSFIDEQIKCFEEKYTETRQEHANAKKQIEDKKACERKVIHYKQQINDVEKELSTHQSKQGRYKGQIQENVVKLKGLCNKLPQHLTAYMAAAEKVVLLSLNLNKERKTLEKLESDFSSVKDSLHRIEQQVDDAERRLSVCKQEEKRMSKEALEKSNGVRPDEEPLKSKFNKFAKTVDGLDTQISKQKAELACLPEVDARIFQEYENRQKKIENLHKNLDELRVELEQSEARIEAIYCEWFPQISQYIDHINQNYRRFFEEMSCAGEVSLHVPENKYDFDNYGVIIRVKFREESELKELDGHRQSGGERAVSTALYMLAMQGLTSAPFRLVDEINQGMDAINERKVFQLLLSIVDHSNVSCQYFLITPKLLRDLDYTPDTNVICVYNGAHSLSHEYFNMNGFINMLARRY